jgi:hypothetical protein
MTLYKAGEGSTDCSPGDFILTHADHSFVDAAIRFGQRLRYRGKRRPFAYWNHAAGVTVGGPDAVLVEMLAAGATVSPLSKYAGRDYILVHVEQGAARRSEAAEYWEWLARTHCEYGYVSILLDAIALLTHLPVGGAWRGRPVCSAAVAAGLGMDEWRSNPSAVLPADLAWYFGATTP